MIKPVGTAGDGDRIAPALATVASFGLPGSRVPRPARPVDDHALESLLAACAREHLVGLLAAAVADGALDVVDPHPAALEALVAEWRPRSHRLELDTIELSGRLDAAGIDHVILDGPVTAHRAYAGPVRRLYATVDILVADAGAARDELDDLVSGRRLRLTTTLLPSGFGAPVGLTDVPARSEMLTIEGRAVPTLSVHAQLVLACVGAVAAEGGSRLGVVRDIAQLALVGGATRDGVAGVASEWRVTAVVTRGIRLAWETFDLADKIELSSWALRYEPSLIERRALRGNHRPGGRLDRLVNALRTPNRAIR